MAEAEAVKRGCHAAWLDTFEFQAKAFYERIGYSCFGKLSDFPRGSSRYFMRKELGRPVKADDAQRQLPTESRPPRFGRAAPVTLATLVGALAGFAFSPVPMLFGAEWLSWALVAVFAAVGGIIAFVYPHLAASESVEK